MRRALYYAIRVKCYRPHVVAITSEKDERHGRTRWYGRRVDYDESTNGTSDQLRGRFDTVEQAVALRDQIAAIAADYEKQRGVHHDAITKLHRAEQDAVEALFSRECVS